MSESNHTGHFLLYGASASLDSVQNASDVGGKKGMTFNKGSELLLHPVTDALFTA